MQLHAERANSVASEPLPLRIGMHAGQVVVKDNDIEGNTVNVAARVAAASKPERILMTRAAAERLNEDFSELLRQWRNEAFKGKTETFELFELNWRQEPEERTIVSRTSENAGNRLFKRLTLRCQGKVCVLQADGKAVTFGRSRHNTLSIADPGHFVSGNHGKIEIRGGSVVLTDNSRNGIFVSFGQGRYFLVDKLLVLRNSGRMALGRAPDESGTVIVEFELE
jgi:hypothetical protein